MIEVYRDVCFASRVNDVMFYFVSESNEQCAIWQSRHDFVTTNNASLSSRLIEVTCSCLCLRAQNVSVIQANPVP